MCRKWLYSWVSGISQLRWSSGFFTPRLLPPPQAATILAAYTSHLKATLVEAAYGHLNLRAPLYPCAAVGAAARGAAEKADIARLAELGRVKRRELQELVEEMARLAPNTKKGAGAGGRGQQELMNKIMGVEQEEEKEQGEESGRMRQRLKEQDLEDDGFEEWRQGILR